ncbi:MAG TPA: AMP-binding protein, partial [Myxococcales bacterium]|nr:AMP-binding protein [Myxococcales bacterium]
MLTGGPAAAMRHLTLHAALESAARSRWGLSFLDAQEHETTLSFAEMYERARRAAGALRELGIERGDRVAIVLPTGPDFMDAFFGAVLAGAVPVPLYPP